MLLPAMVVMAQPERNYGSFLHADTSISWAAEAEKVVALVPRSLTQGLNAFYRERLAAGALSVYEPGTVPFSVKRRVAAPGGLPAPQRLHIERRLIERNVPYALRGFIDTARNHGFACDTCAPGLELFQLRQLVYYKAGRFFVDNILVSPVGREVDSSGGHWYTSFRSSFHGGGKKPASDPKQLVYLGTAQVNYYFNFRNVPGPGEEKVLTYQEPNPFQRILSDAGKGRIRLRNEMVDEERRPVVSPKKLMEQLTVRDTITVYDVNDPNITTLQVAESTLDPSTVNGYGIEQSFYYDPKNDVLLSRVHRVVLKREVQSSGGLIRGRAPMVSIDYSAPPQQAVKPIF